MINVKGNISVRQIVNMPGSVYNGKTQEKYNVVLKGWLARYENGELHLIVNPREEDKFRRSDMDHLYGFWNIISGADVELDKHLFPDIRWEDDYPTEVQITIQ